jgi:hypothetical protein
LKDADCLGEVAAFAAVAALGLLSVTVCSGSDEVIEMTEWSYTMVNGLALLLAGRGTEARTRTAS